MAQHLLSEKEKESEIVIQTIRIYSQDIGKEFDIENYVILIMRSGKRKKKRKEKRNRKNKSKKNQKPGEKEIYKYLGILEVDTIKQIEMKDKIGKEYIRILNDSQMIDKYLDHARELKKAVKQRSYSDINCSWCAWTGPQ